MAANGDTPVLQAKPVPEGGGDIIHQTITQERSGKRTALADRGLTKIVVVHSDGGMPNVRICIVLPSTLDKIENILEDEAVG